MYLLAAGAAVGLTAAPAHADWQYAKWEMTQQELVSASRGKAWAVTDTNRPFKFGLRVAESMATIDGQDFKVAFYGSGGVYNFGASSMNVPYKITNIRFEPGNNCESILDYLRGKYRNTSETVGGEYRFADGEDEIWYDPGYSRCSFRRFRKGRF